MGTITNAGTKPTEFAGEYKLWSFYNLAVATASDTLTLTAAANNISEIQNVVATVAGGQDAAFTNVAASFSDLVITVTSVEQDGTAATEFTGTTVNLLVVGK